MAALVPRVVVVRRNSDYEELLARHATHGQARFFLESRGQDIDDVQAAHDRLIGALDRVAGAIPAKWRRNAVHRTDLSRFLFEPEDIVVAVGQDGLVANVAKYLAGQPVIGINPMPERFDGILVPHPVEAAEDLLHTTAAGRAGLQRRTMAEAALDDGQRLLALNEVFVGQRTHQSARYRLRFGREERQSSSGVIAATGTGATGWARSISESRRTAVALPRPEDPDLAFFVREAFPSVATGTTLTEGLIEAEQTLEVVSEMNDGGVIFGDGIEDDRLIFGWGQTVNVRRSKETLNLVVG